MVKAEYDERLQMAINDGSKINPDDLVIVNLDDLGEIREKLIT